MLSTLSSTTQNPGVPITNISWPARFKPATVHCTNGKLGLTPTELPISHDYKRNDATMSSVGKMKEKSTSIIVSQNSRVGASEENVKNESPFTLEEIADVGRGAMMNVAAIADKITSVASAGDIDEIGDSFASLLNSAREYDPKNFKGNKGFLGFFRKKVASVKNRYQTIDRQVDQLISETDNRIGLFKTRIGDLANLYEQNQKYHGELASIRHEMQERIAWMKENVPEVQESDSFSAQKRADWLASIDYAEKRADDLQRAMILSEQQAPQIRLMAMNSSGLVQKFSEIKSTTIPVLKNAFGLYILNIEQEKGAKFANEVDNLTNKTLIENSKKLGENTATIHKSLSRSTIDIGTLEETQKVLIASISSVEQIHNEMRQRLMSERPKLEQLSKDLTLRLSGPKNTQDPKRLT
jgi:uncharacterized protein YaaN involved in tellurite resistance